jgi:murein DD-endopeptidase MepM/ murein hydrolase activator NlpD
VPLRSPDARRRVGQNAPTKPRRLITALVLPTVAAVALTLTASGAAMATSPKTKSVTFGHTGAAAAAPQAAAGDLNPIRTSSIKTAQQDLAVARATAAARAARSTDRMNLVALVSKVARAAQTHGWQLPVKGYVLTSGFGPRGGGFHAGEDFAVPIGTNLTSMSTGTVDFAGQESGFGNIVKICYWDGTISFFGHMSAISVNVGESVGTGEVVGQSGNTGDSTGPHMHLEIHPNGGAAVDPLPWLADHNIAP